MMKTNYNRHFGYDRVVMEKTLDGGILGRERENAFRPCLWL